MHHDPNFQPRDFYRELPYYGSPSDDFDDHPGIDLFELLKKIWSKRTLIFKITGVFIFLGLLIALLSPTEYTAEATLIPEVKSSQGSASSLLREYGSILGIRGASNTGYNSTIPPQLYPNIVQSLPYQIELMNAEVSFSEFDTTTTLYSFFNEIYSPFSLIGFIKSYTIGLPARISSLFAGENLNDRTFPRKISRDSVLVLSQKQMGTVNKLRERLMISVDQETGLLEITAILPDPRGVAELAKTGIRLLKENVKEYRTEKARQNLEFVQEQVKEARIRFEEAQNRLAEFRDSNLNLATAKAKSREQELQSQYDLTFDLYNTLSQRLEQAKLDLQEETPVLSVLQPVSVPLNKSAPNSKLIILISGILGSILSLGWILVKDWWETNI